MIKQYPLTLNLKQKKVLVVGAGRVALRIIQGLLGTGALVTVVAPKVMPEIAGLSDINVVERAFEKTDTQQAHIVFAATDDPEVNEEVGKAVEQWQWFHDTSFAESSSFDLPVVTQVDDLVVSIISETRDTFKERFFKEKITEFLQLQNIRLRNNQIRNTVGL